MAFVRHTLVRLDIKSKVTALRYVMLCYHPSICIMFVIIVCQSSHIWKIRETSHRHTQHWRFCAGAGRWGTPPTFCSPLPSFSTDYLLLRRTTQCSLGTRGPAPDFLTRTSALVAVSNKMQIGSFAPIRLRLFPQLFLHFIPEGDTRLCITICSVRRLLSFV